MLTLKLINEETERVIRGLQKKHFEGAAEAIAAVQATDRRRREAQQQLDQLLAESKKKAAVWTRLRRDSTSNSIRFPISPTTRCQKELLRRTMSS